MGLWRFNLHILSRNANIKDALERLKNVDKNKTIVIYCSVGIKSSKLANELQNAGYHNVYNLEGSIFKWAHKGYPVYKWSQRVYRVHPYDRRWCVLLNNDL
jgi:rhodanese-related sulfurtransferase